jgi:Leucine-rich repeat (LRR) protein
MKSLSHITGLHLNGSKVTDAGLAPLEGLDNIGHINLEGTAVTDAGIAHLRNMTHLQMLIVTNSKVTDVGVASLKKSLPHLHVTNLSRAEANSEQAITDAGGIRYSDADGRLTEIRFAQRKLDDAALQRLRKELEVWKSTLRSIDLTNSAITDAGLEALTGLTGLQKLTLTGTDVTVAGVKMLQRSAPNLKVKH